MTEDQRVPPGVDPAMPSPARLYDYYLGGTDNFPADRDAAEKIRARMPELADAAWANRGFHQRAALWLAGSRGIRQFMDIGSGLPAQNNTHRPGRRRPRRPASSTRTTTRWSARTRAPC
jgi:S-adenosyl methyltransferase